MSSESRTDIWSRFISGDMSCFKKVYLNYYKEMYGYGVKLCNRPELVEDCIQELFKNIWERRDELSHIKSANIYLFVSLRRKIMDRLEKQQRMNRTHEEGAKSSHIKFVVDEIMIRRELRKEQKEELAKALNQLSDRQKEVVYLYFYNGMSYNEIAEIMSVNRQSVYNHMHKAMEALRSYLDVKLVKLVITLAITFLLFL